MTAELLDIFNAHSGIVSCVGAGGKKTTMFRLAEAHSGRVGITATAHIEYFPKTLKARRYIGEEAEIIEAIKNDDEAKCIAFAKPSGRFGRRAGVSVDSLAQFKKIGNFELLVVKADGARGRFVKAPAEHEPAIAPCSDTIIPILSAQVMGMALTDDIAHRVNNISRVTGLKQGERIQAEHIARLLSSEHGSLKNIGNANVIPLINMVDNSNLEKISRDAAKVALQLTDRFDKVVLAAMKKDQAIVDVITR